MNVMTMNGVDELSLDEAETSALLNLLDDATIDCVEATCAASAAPESVIVTSPEKKKRTRNLSRERRKAEFLYLRGKVVELEHTLRHLQAQPSVRIASGSTSNSNVIHQSKTWQHVALRQLEYRQRAEHENARLKKLCTTQLKLMKSLKKALRIRPELVELTSSIYPQPSPLVASNCVVDSTEILAFLITQLDGCMRELDSVFVSNGLHALSSEFSDARVMMTMPLNQEGAASADQFVVEIREVQFYPMSTTDAARMSWNLLSEYSQGECLDMGADADVKTAVRTHFALPTGRQVESKSYLAMKRFRLDDRFLFVWTCDIDYVLGDGAYCIRMYEMGYSEMKPCTRLVGQALETGTITKTCTRTMPWPFPDLARQQDSHSRRILPSSSVEIGTLTDLVLHTFKADTEFLGQAMQRQVMQEILDGTPQIV